MERIVSEKELKRFTKRPVEKLGARGVDVHGNLCVYVKNAGNKTIPAGRLVTFTESHKRDKFLKRRRLGKYDRRNEFNILPMD